MSMIQIIKLKGGQSIVHFIQVLSQYRPDVTAFRDLLGVKLVFICHLTRVRFELVRRPEVILCD